MRVFSSPPESSGCLIPCPAPWYPHPQGLSPVCRVPRHPSTEPQDSLRPLLSSHQALRCQTISISPSGDHVLCRLPSQVPAFLPPLLMPPVGRWLECHWEDVQKDSADGADLLAQLATLDSDEDASEEGDEEDDDDCSQNEESISTGEVKESRGQEDSPEMEEAGESPGLDDLDFIQFDAPARQREEEDDDELVMSVVPRSIPHKRAAPLVVERSDKKKKKLRPSPSQKKQT